MPSYNMETCAAKHLIMKSTGTTTVSNVYYEFPLEGEFENELEFEGEFDIELIYEGYYDG